MNSKLNHSLRQIERTLLITGITLVCLLAVIPARISFAQAVASAKMHGVVTDESGLVVPNAQVDAIQTDSGFAASAKTDGNGLFILTNLPVGPYKVSISAQGFQGYLRSGIVLQVGNDAAINVALKVGTKSETITVNADAAQVQTEDAMISTVVDQQRTVDLPLNGRNAASLVLLSGATAPTTNGNMTSTKTYGSTGTSAIGGSLNIAVAGGQGNQVNYLLDGADHNDSFSNVNMPFPFPDALQEFSVQTTGLPAQYGVHPSGAVNIVTKAGTNDWHGGAFEFLRNDYTSAANPITGKVTPLKRNQYGGYMGGPILRGKLFFFGGYQATNLRISPSSTSSYVPTQTMINGDWTSYVAATKATLKPAAGFVYNPTTGTTTIDTGLYSPAAKALMKYLPVNSTSSAAGLVAYAVPAPQDETQWIGRLDYTISPSQNVFTRYFMTNYYQKGLFNGNLLNAINPNLKDRAKSFIVGDSFAITPNILNILHVAATRMAISRGAPGDLISPSTLGSNVYSSVPNYIYLNVSGGFTASCGTCAPTHFVGNHYQATDDLSILKGKHFIQFGADYLHEELNLAGLNTENGQFTFNGSYGGTGLADLMLGAPNSFSQGFAPGALGHLRYNYFGYYGQDTFHLSKQVTISAGLRWEPWFPEFEKDNKGGTFSWDAFNSNTVSTVYTNAPAGMRFVGDKGVKPGFINTRLTNFSPRLGLVFDPTGSGKQTLRASYILTFEAPEMYYDSGFPVNAPYANAQSVTIDNSTNLTDTQKSFDNPWKKVVGGNPFPSAPPSTSAVFPAANISTQIYAPNLRRTYANQWNLSYQLQASRNWLLSASYIGTHTVHLWGFVPVNYATPVATPTGAAPTTSNTSQRYILYRDAIANGTTAGTRYSNFSATADYGMANFHGIIITANHRVANNFSLLFNYAYSHCLSNMNYTGDNTPPAQDPSNFRGEYGSCNFDTTQNINISGVLTSPKLKSRMLDYAIGGWTLSPLVTHRTGMPYTVTTGTDVSLTGIGQDRPNLVSGQPLYAKNLNPAGGGNRSWFNTAAYTLAAAGTFGNERPFQARGPGYTNIDAAASKRFRIYERSQFEFRAEAFDLFNHPNYSNPVTAMNSTSTFGKITSTINDARVLQGAIKITF